MDRWFYVETPEISAIVQQLAFAADFYWICAGRNVQDENQEVLWFKTGKTISYSSLKYAKGYAKNQINTIEELIEFFVGA